MQVNIGEVTFKTKFAPKNFGSRIILKISECSYYQYKREKLLLNPWNYFLGSPFCYFRVYRF